jgi:hypothetical protein
VQIDPSPPPFRCLLKYVGQTFSTDAERYIKIDKIYETSKVTWTLMTYGNLLELDYLPPRNMLLLVIRAGDQRSTELLLERGMNPNGTPVVKENDPSTDNPLLESLSCGYYNIAHSLLKHGADSYCYCTHKGTPLHYANTVELARLCYHPTFLEMFDGSGWTALHRACYNHHVDVALFIMERMNAKQIHLRNKRTNHSAFDYFVETLKSPDKRYDVGSETVKKLASQFIALGYPGSQLMPYVLTTDCVVHVLDARARTLIPHKKLVLLKLIHVMGQVAHELTELEVAYKAIVKTPFAKEGVGELQAFIKLNHKCFKIARAGRVLVSGNQPLQL